MCSIAISAWCDIAQINDKAKQQRVAARKEAQKIRRDAQAEVQQMRAEAEADILQMKQRMLKETKEHIRQQTELATANLQNRIHSKIKDIFDCDSLLKPN